MYLLFRIDTYRLEAELATEYDRNVAHQSFWHS